MRTYGSVAVSVWLTTKRNWPKILVQGKAYFSFICLALPYIIRHTSKIQHEIEHLQSSQTSEHAFTPQTPAAITTTAPTLPTTGGPTPIVDNSDPPKVPKPAGPTPPAGGQTDPPGAGRRVGVLH